MGTTVRFLSVGGWNASVRGVTGGQEACGSAPIRNCMEATTPEGRQGVAQPSSCEAAKSRGAEPLD
ncbi:hypothetical protein SCOCK_550017 [Actinacidiphila cocklensis]|uniref:Uncharacterized protein n=1 Tax=Actinacidiphila cocklensis TaxID=887465 RepID=A0A9W4GUN4_9ACTN|nr:hypothetical protein SCOCK_550017 [Actinacidiphila cocklensis]